jgi:hypothetical protein
MILCRLPATCRFISATRAWPAASAAEMICSVACRWAWCCGRNSAVVTNIGQVKRGIRCPLLRIDPAQRGRLEEIRDNLHARIAEAEREGWTGEAEGLKVSLDAANNKIAQADLSAARHTEAVSMGIPAYRDIAAATLTTGGPHRH